MNRLLPLLLALALPARSNPLELPPAATGARAAVGPAASGGTAESLNVLFDGVRRTPPVPDAVDPGSYADLDKGVRVRVVNASSYDEGWVKGLVVGADRSTQQDGPTRGQFRKGLFNAGDVIIVTDDYLAWLDFTSADGTGFDRRLYADWHRSGTLTGFWTLDPATRNFKYAKLGPNGFAWAANELIPGSASPDGQQHWWDAYAPPLEHSMVAITPDCPWPKCFFSFEYGRSSPNSGWRIVKDGVREADGVHFMYTSFMVSWKNHVDIFDGDDANGISNKVQASAEYVFGPSGVRVRFRFSPEKDLVVNNLYAYIWTDFGQDIDGTPCDPHPNHPGTLYPDKTYYDAQYSKSSKTMRHTYGPSEALPPGKTYRNTAGPTCDKRPDGSYDNYVSFTSPNHSIERNDFITLGESPTGGTEQPRWKFTYEGGAAGSGDGLAGNPFQIRWDNMNIFNETSDGTWGIGIGRGPGENTELKAGQWYGLDYRLSTSVE